MSLRVRGTRTAKRWAALRSAVAWGVIASIDENVPRNTAVVVEFPTTNAIDANRLEGLAMDDSGRALPMTGHRRKAPAAQWQGDASDPARRRGARAGPRRAAGREVDGGGRSRVTSPIMPRREGLGSGRNSPEASVGGPGGVGGGGADGVREPELAPRLRSLRGAVSRLKPREQVRAPETVSCGAGEGTSRFGSFRRPPTRVAR